MHVLRFEYFGASELLLLRRRYYTIVIFVLVVMILSRFPIFRFVGQCDLIVHCIMFVVRNTTER